MASVIRFFTPGDSDALRRARAARDAAQIARDAVLPAAEQVAQKAQQVTADRDQVAADRLAADGLARAAEASATQAATVVGSAGSFLASTEYGPSIDGLRSVTVDIGGRDVEQQSPHGTEVFPSRTDNPMSLREMADAAEASARRAPLIDGIESVHYVTIGVEERVVQTDGQTLLRSPDGTMESPNALAREALAKPVVISLIGPLLDDGLLIEEDPNGRIMRTVGVDGRTYTLGLDGQLYAVYTAPPEPSPEPDLLPLYGPHLHLLPDRSFPLYLRNLFAIRADVEFARVTFSSGGYAATALDRLAIDPARCGTSGALTIVRRDLIEDARIRLPLAVRVAAPAGQTPRVLAIGDSITNRGMLDLINARLTGLGITPSWVGTVPTAAASSTNPGSSAGPLGEARESRAWADLVYSILDGEATPLPPGEEAAYLALTKGNRLAYNPFIRAATGGDAPEIVRNGYVFDLGFYLTRFAFAAPAIMLIGLGENDCQESTVPGPIVEDALRIVLAQARAAVPAMRIGLWVSGQASSVSGDVRWTDRKAQVLRAIVRTVRDIGDPLVSVISAWAHQTPDADWETAGAVTNPQTGAEAGAVTDHIHPLGAARQEIAEAIAAYVAWAA